MHPSVPLEDNLSLSSSLPVTCQMLCMADNFLMTLAMFYVVTMAIYLFCRPAKPDYAEKVLNEKRNRVCKKVFMFLS